MKKVMQLSFNRKYEEYYVKNPIIIINITLITMFAKINGEEPIVLSFIVLSRIRA